MEEDILIERERAKAIVQSVIKNTLAWREREIKRKHRRGISLLKGVEERILYHLDHPKPAEPEKVE